MTKFLTVLSLVAFAAGAQAASHAGAAPMKDAAASAAKPAASAAKKAHDKAHNKAEKMEKKMEEKK